MAWRKPQNMREWMRLLYRHRNKFFFPMIVMMICVMWGAKLWYPRQYSAEAKFLRQNDAMIVQAEGRASAIARIRPIQRMLPEHIRGSAALDALIEDLQMSRDLPHEPDGELTREGRQMKTRMRDDVLQKKIKVGFKIKSDEVDLISVSYTGPDREMVPQIVNKLVENYIRKTKQRMDQNLIYSKALYEREVARARARFTDLEQRKLQFQMDNPGLRPNDPLYVNEQISKIKDGLDIMERNIDMLREKRAGLQSWIDGQPDEIAETESGENPEYTSKVERAQKLEDQLVFNLNQMGRTEMHPAVRSTRERLLEAREELKSIEQTIEKGERRMNNDQKSSAILAVKQITSELASLERQQADRTTKLEKMQTLERQFFARRNEFQQLENEFEAAKQQLAFWKGNLRRTLRSLTVEVGQYGVRLHFLERAADRGRPSSPMWGAIVAIALILGMITGALVICISEIFDHAYHNIDHAVDDMKLPVLGAVNEIVTPSEAFRRKIISWGVYPTIVTVLAVILAVSIGLIYLDLQYPIKHELLFSQPGKFFSENLFGTR